jgi:hypothetical protein
MIYVIDQIFVTCILHMFNEGTVSGPADIISVLNFSPHVVEQVDVATASLNLPKSSGKVVANGGTTQHP